eukprot:568345-Rhodomonas_salina.2
MTHDGMRSEMGCERAESCCTDTQDESMRKWEGRPSGGSGSAMTRAKMRSNIAAASWRRRA